MLLFSADSIPESLIRVPKTCPALGIAIRINKKRSASSPSLDRIIPAKGYVPGNIRVISDRANRLKSDFGYAEIEHRASSGTAALRSDYQMLLTYLERESLLAEVREKALVGGRAGEEWVKIAQHLDRLFSRSISL